MDAGFGGEDEYNTYTKPLFDRAEAGSVYRPRASAEDVYGDAETQYKELSDTSRFKADKGFRGAEQSAVGGKRDAPVQFERGDGEGRREERGRDAGRRDDREDRGYYGPSGGSDRGRDRNSDHSDRRGGGGGDSGRRREEEDPFGIRDIVDDSSRKRSRRD
jgi:SNW domain-containing protein 1